MFQLIDLSPRLFGRSYKLDCGLEIPTKEKTHVTPTPFGAERAKEIMELAKCRANLTGVREHMTDGEIVYVYAVWDCCSGSATWATAFFHIRCGNVEANQEVSEVC